MDVSASAAAKAKDAIKPFGPDISFIIRVSQVPDTAKSNDLREFFSGITIPFGGLVILGGTQGDAFVGFTNDESARMAMQRTGNTLHGAKVSCRLSSRSEMEQLLTKRFAEIALFTQILPAVSKKPAENEPKRDVLSSVAVPQTPHVPPAPYKPEGSANAPPATNGSGSWKLPSYQAPKVQSPPISRSGWSATPHAQHSDVPTSGRFQYSQAGPPNPSTAPDYSRKQSSFNGPNVKQESGYSASYGAPTHGYGASSYAESKPAFAGAPPMAGPAGNGVAAREPFNTRPVSQHTPALNPATLPHSLPTYAQINTSTPPSSSSATQQFTYQQHYIQQEPYPPSVPVPNHLITHHPPPNVLPPPVVNQGFPPRQPPPSLPALNPLAFSGAPIASAIPADPISAKALPDALFVEFSHLPPHLIRPSSLEEFLRPSVSLSLSSVKVIVDSHGQATHSLVRFGCVEDAHQALQRDGHQGIRVRPITRPVFESAVDGSVSAQAAASRSDSWINRSSPPRRRSPPRRPERRQRRERPSPPRNDRRKNDEKSSGPTRSRSRSPRSRDDEESRKRPDRPSDDKGGRERRRSRERSPETRRRRSGSPKRRRETERFCVQLLNVPFKATFNDVKSYIVSLKAYFTKCNRTYYTDRDVTDRWIIEFDDASEMQKLTEHQGEMRGRPIRAEQITPLVADELYAIPEPRRNREGAWSNGKERVERAPPRFEDGPWRKGGEYIPKITLEASTEDELITRGDLPPSSFGAFSGPSVVKHGVYQNGVTRMIGTLDRPFRPDGPPDMAQTRYGARPPLLPSGPGASLARPPGPGYQRMPRPPFHGRQPSGQSFSPVNQPPVADPQVLEKQAERHLRPYLGFVEAQKSDPSLRTSIRLGNVPPFTFAEKLCAFLGVPLHCPPENIVRVSTGELYVNLATEAHAEQAAKHSGLLIDDTHAVTVDQVPRAEMAAAIDNHLHRLSNLNTLLIGDSDEAVKEDEIKDFFRKFAAPEQVVREKGQSGVAFLVRFSSARDAATAMDAGTSAEFNGRKLRIIPYDGQAI